MYQQWNPVGREKLKNQCYCVIIDEAEIAKFIVRMVSPFVCFECNSLTAKPNSIKLIPLCIFCDKIKAKADTSEANFNKCSYATPYKNVCGKST